MSEINQARDRPISAYIPQGQQPTGYPGNQMQHQPPPPRSQSSRDIIRQEAKLQEMQEEVRRRELRGVAAPPGTNQYRPNAYNVRPMSAAQTANAIRPARPIGSTPNLGPNSPTYNTRPIGPNYAYSDVQYSQYGQFAKHPQVALSNNRLIMLVTNTIGDLPILNKLNQFYCQKFIYVFSLKKV